MNRRTLLKTLMASPLLGLFKIRKSGASARLTYMKRTAGGASAPCCQKEFYETTGTSSEGTIFFWSETEGIYTKEQLHPLGERHIDGTGRVWTYVKWQGNEG